MSSSSSSDVSVLGKGQENVHEARRATTPRTSFGSADHLGNEIEEKRHRRNSNVRFKDEESKSFFEGEIQASSVPTLRDPSQTYVDGLGERLNRLEDRLENQFQNTDLQRPPDFSEKGDSSSERPTLATESSWMTWQEYLEPISKASSILEVLVEKPHTNARRKSSLAQPVAQAVPKAPEKPLTTPVKNIERIRVRSIQIINALQQITEQTFPFSSCFTIHRPFKILLFYEDAIKDYVSELECSLRQSLYCPLGKRCSVSSVLDKPHIGSSHQNHTGKDAIHRGSSDKYHTTFPDEVPDHNDMAQKQASTMPLERRPSKDSAVVQNQKAFSGSHIHPTRLDENDDDECKHEESDDLLSQIEAIDHLRALLKFMSEDMREIYKRHRLLRSPEPQMVSFEDIWHLFMAGDLVVTNDDSNPMIYRVSIIPAEKFFSSRRPVKKMKLLRSDGSHQQVESVYNQESMTVLHIDVFFFDFDGQNFGPVETRLTIVSWKGLKKVTDLPFYPLRFREDAEIFKAKRLDRGRRFRELSAISHWEYNGLSAQQPQEQIDSQVIVDIPLAYQKHPDHAPRFGLKSWIEDDARIVTEACGVPGCTECFKESFMFDDHRIDRQRTVEFIRGHGSLLRTISDSEELAENMLVLLPNRVYGFVLRSRRWCFLDIDKLHSVQRQSEGFESLILPPGVARLVEGLVQTHGARNKRKKSSSDSDGDHQVDLVRGKGKGLIILLHGAPGVGKTSTAECVADYAHRPLFPITCGDIGETAKEVEQNLEQNFHLAHRWGCVLLLDEADVFLQARDKEDMRRNSVVSVFLRVLEYYSGILFLTTNKVGHFDEAFKSRIHVSLYYPPLDEEKTVQIWKMNLRRLVESKKHIEVDRKAIKKYAKRHYTDLHKAKRATWNGRQIKNAFQTAIALAEFDAKKEDQSKPVLSIDHFEVVAKASEGFDLYLSRIHGTDTDRARREGQRDDDARDDRTGLLLPLSLKRKKHESTESSSSEDSEEEKRKSKKARSAKKKGKEAKAKAKTKAQASDSEGSSGFSSSEEEKKRHKKDKPVGK